MTSNKTKNKKGFTPAEKWIIWGVFCLLVALSVQRFSVFAGLMIFSVGISFFLRKEKLVLATIVSIIGILALGFSKFLI
jgi:hypothetical protein